MDNRYRPSCFSPKADHVAHGFKTKKKKEYKDDFFKNNILGVSQKNATFFCTEGRLMGRFRIKEKIIDMLLR
jgi:hypothetical protein